MFQDFFMYNHTMIEMNISSRGKYVKRIKDIQLSKQQRNETLQMAFMSEYKREYKYCTLKNINSSKVLCF